MAPSSDIIIISTNHGSSSSSPQPSQPQSQQRGLRVLKFVTFVVACFTFNDLIQFQRTLQYKSQKVSNDENNNINKRGLLLNATVSASTTTNKVNHNDNHGNHGDNGGNSNNNNLLNSDYIPLEELVRANEKVNCGNDPRLFPAPIVIINDTQRLLKLQQQQQQKTTEAEATEANPDDDDIVPQQAANNNPNANIAAINQRPNSEYLIPRILHMTGEGKCLTQPFLENAKAWTFEGSGWNFLFHDRAAKQRLLNKHWPEFPQLQNAIRCLENAGGAAKSDLWRYLVLWEYGGFYTDMDNGPGPLLNSTSVNKIFAYDIDGWFIQDRAGSPNFPAQHFFGVSPHHPVMYYAVMQVLEAMMSLQEVGTFDVPDTTGPSALDRAFLQFMQVPRDEWAGNKQKWLRHPLTKPSMGTYVGSMNRTVTIYANSASEFQYIKVSVINGARKKEGWKLMGMNDYRALNKVPQNKTCLQLILEQHLEEKMGIQANNNPIVTPRHTATKQGDAKSWATIQKELGWGIKPASAAIAPQDYLGCYGDEQNDRALTTKQEGSSFRISDCRLQCAKRGFTYAGLQYGAECYCGKSGYDKHGKKAENECNMDCTSGGEGEGGFKCGGVFRTSVYKASWNV